MNKANKSHLWKACNRHKRFPSSNLGHSAIKSPLEDVFKELQKIGETSPNTGKGSRKTEKRPKVRQPRVSFYMRKAQIDKQGTAPLTLCVNYGGNSAYIPIGTRLAPSQWDAKAKRVINHPHASTINSVLRSMLGRAQDAVLELVRKGGVRGLTARQVRDRIADYLQPPQAQDAAFLAVMARYMAQCKRTNTAEKYKYTIKRVIDFSESPAKAKRLQFSDITPEWLHDFERWLVTFAPSANSRAIHLRNIRTVFNYALDHDLTTAKYPFKKYKIKTQPTQPNALTVKQLKKLWKYQPPTAGQAYALDMWRLSFTLIGINMIDLCQLRKIVNGRVNYTRAKTGRLYSVKVEPAAKELIDRHRGRNALVDLLDKYKDYRNATVQTSKRLREIAKALNFPSLTMYSARYTWASVAMSLDVPIEVISQALGHSYGLAVTLGYIMPDRRKVDEANIKVLALL